MLAHDIINYSAMIVIIEEKKEIVFLLGGYRCHRDMMWINIDTINAFK